MLEPNGRTAMTCHGAPKLNPARFIRLEAQGYLEAEWQQHTEGGRPPRHAYRLTGSGVQLARANPPGHAGTVAWDRGAAAI